MLNCSKHNWQALARLGHQGGEECIERGPKTISNTFFQGGAKICSEEAKPPASLLATGPIIGNHFFVFHKFSLPSTFLLPPLPYRRSGVPVYNSLRKIMLFRTYLYAGAEPDIFIWGATWGASFATRGAVNGLCRTFRKRPTPVSWRHAENFGGAAGGQAKFWGAVAPPGTPLAPPLLVWWGKPEGSFPCVHKPADKSPSFLVHHVCLHAERRTITFVALVSGDFKFRTTIKDPYRTVWDCDIELIRCIPHLTYL